MRQSGVAFLLAVTLAAAACSSATKSAGNPNNTACRLSMTLTGEVNLEFGDGDVTCANVNGISELISLFAPKSNAVVTGIGIAVIQFVAGQVSTGYSSTVDVELADGRSFGALGCTVDIAENAAVGTATNGTQYRVSGQGQCRGPAITSGASIDVSPFEFTTIAIR